MKAVIAFLCLFLAHSAHAQSGGAQNPPTGGSNPGQGGQNTQGGGGQNTTPPVLSAAVQAAGEHADGGVAVSLILKNTSGKPARFMLVEFHGVSPVLILPNANTSNGVFHGIEACDVPTSGCMARNRGWIDLAPNADIMVAIAFRQRPYVSGRASLTLQIVQEVNGKRGTSQINVRSVTLP